MSQLDFCSSANLSATALLALITRMKKFNLMFQDELITAGVLVRVYNEQPDFVFSPEEATAFCKGLVTWISQYSRAETFCLSLSKSHLPDHWYLINHWLPIKDVSIRNNTLNGIRKVPRPQSWEMGSFTGIKACSSIFSASDLHLDWRSSSMSILVLSIPCGISAYCFVKVGALIQSFIQKKMMDL